LDPFTVLDNGSGFFSSWQWLSSLFLIVDSLTWVFKEEKLQNNRNQWFFKNILSVDGRIRIRTKITDPSCTAGLALKNPHKKTHPKKPKKTHLKKPTKNGFFWVF
jgi:hypothetical protein